MFSQFEHLYQPADTGRHQPRVLPPDDFRHQAERHGELTIRPHSPIIGGIVEGFRFRPGLQIPDTTRRFLYLALLKYGFLTFPAGAVSLDTFEAFTGLFGKVKFAGNPQAPRVGASGETNAIDSTRKRTRTNYIWHIDQAYRSTPQKFTALHAIKAPPTGGGTLFSNATAAYRLLDPALAQYLETLTVLHNADQMGLVSMSYPDAHHLIQARLDTPPLEVPLVRVHPETGAKQLFACELYAQRILGVPRTVSDHLLGIVFDYIKTPEICTEYRWEEGATLIWDNRIVQHRGIFNYGGQDRILHRAVID